MADQWQDTVTFNSAVRDDDDDIPDAWDADPEEKPQKPVVEEVKKTPATSKNKASKKKYAGDANNSDEELMNSLKEPDREYTAEELEELRKRAEIQKEEIKLNMLTEFMDGSNQRKSLDDVNLQTKEELLDYSFRLYNRLELLSKTEFYTEFIEHVLTGLTKNMTLDGIKRMSNLTQTILNQKQNEEREKKNKSKPKKAVKSQFNVEPKSEYDSFFGEGVTKAQVEDRYDVDNDFM